VAQSGGTNTKCQPVESPPHTVTSRRTAGAITIGTVTLRGDEHSVGSVQEQSVSRVCHGHGHGHGIFILATHPEGTCPSGTYLYGQCCPFPAPWGSLLIPIAALSTDRLTLNNLSLRLRYSVGLSLSKSSAGRSLNNIVWFQFIVFNMNKPNTTSPLQWRNFTTNSCLFVHELRGAGLQRINATRKNWHSPQEIFLSLRYEKSTACKYVDEVQRTYDAVYEKIHMYDAASSYIHTYIHTPL
jgi:hypothetical protein